MTNQPAPSTTELFQLAATLAGCQTIDLVDVRITGSGLIVGLATGQQFIFNPATLEAQVSDILREQLAQLIGAAAAPDASAAAQRSGDPAPAAGKTKTPAPKRGAGEGK